LHIYEIQTKFVYKGRRVKVNVIGAKRSKIPIPVRKTSIGNKHAWISATGGGVEWCDRYI